METFGHSECGRSARYRSWRTFAAAFLILSIVTAHDAIGGIPPVLCPGDCNDDGQVTVDEIILVTMIALGAASPDLCPIVTELPNVDYIVTSVNNALVGCPPIAAQEGNQ